MCPLGEDSWELGPGFFWASPHAPFPFADFALCPATVINLSCEYNYMLSPVSPAKESMNLWVFWGTPMQSQKWASLEEP